MLRRRGRAPAASGTERADVLGPIAEHAFLRLAEEASGQAVHLSVPREVQGGGYGPDAIRFYVDDPPTGWGSPLVVRVYTGPEAAAAADLEIAWHEFVVAGGMTVTEVLAHTMTEADGPDDGDPAAVVVLAGGPERSLLEQIADRPMDVGELMGRSGQIHAQLHAVDVGGAPGLTADEHLGDALDVLSARADMAEPAAWLQAHRPAIDEPVVCHGDFQPTHVRVEPDLAGEPMVANWTVAFVGSPEWDVAITILTLWSAPHLAPGRAQRMMLKMARDHLIDGYLDAYRAERTLDEDRLAYYGAYQAAAWAARANDGPVAGDPWDVVHLVDDPRGLSRELMDRFRELTR